MHIGPCVNFWAEMTVAVDTVQIIIKFLVRITAGISSVQTFRATFLRVQAHIQIGYEHGLPVASENITSSVR
jgi:hypothetical protein